jgi:multidrug efflux pump subunit AcrA (membrane-fusion protein)
MRQRGFVLPALPIWAWGAIGSFVVITGLGLAVKVQTARLDAAKAEIAKVQADYDAFKGEVERFGREAKARADAERERHAKVNRERESSYEKRIAALNDAYRRLRDSNTRRGDLPPIPNAPVCPDGAADREQLLAVLRSADENTAKLIELQQWIREH